MNYREYFENTGGTGVLSTSSRDGRVDSALYSRPHVMEDNSFAFIMHDRLTDSNIRENPYAVYLFIEEGSGSRGKRLYLKKLKEESDPELIASLRRRTYPEEKKEDTLYLVYFTLERELPLVGAGGK